MSQKGGDPECKAGQHGKVKPMFKVKWITRTPSSLKMVAESKVCQLSTAGKEGGGEKKLGGGT